MSNRKPTAAAAGLVALAMLAVPLMLSPARADGARSRSCVGAGDSYTCVTSWRHGATDPNTTAVPAPTPQELTESRNRERRWLARCRPVVRQDAYGVPRYHYAAAGCEFGKYE